MGLAWLVYRMNFGTGPVTAGIIAVYVIACLAGGFVAGKLMRKDRYRWGTLTGLCYFMLLLLVSFAVQGKWNMTVSHAVTDPSVCVLEVELWEGCWHKKKSLLFVRLLCYTMPR